MSSEISEQFPPIDGAENSKFYSVPFDLHEV